ncbi:poly(rC)-binding protein 2-like [Misgurnus anguillicaudatus]|uniref:poly(rC)-binding protein 2-like n=1 Tax=Misgurnus anguillicaudatus TaxID=75329 RepID=UPI003CCFD838
MTVRSSDRRHGSRDRGYMEGLTISLKLLMHGKEVGSIIRKSGAPFNISVGCPERVVTISGRNDAVFEAVGIIIDQIEKNIYRVMESSTAKWRHPATLRIVVPSSQCGYIIGKGGCKIKEIMKLSGAHIEVAERAVTIAGTSPAIHACFQQICVVMEEHDSSLGSLLFFFRLL